MMRHGVARSQPCPIPRRPDRPGRAWSCWCTFTAAFLLLQALPGDAIMIQFHEPGDGPVAARRSPSIRASYGADLPMWQRYFTTLEQLPHRQFRLLDPGRRAGRPAARDQPAADPAAGRAWRSPRALVLTVVRGGPVQHRLGFGWLRAGAAVAAVAASSRCRCSGSASC